MGKELSMLDEICLRVRTVGEHVAELRGHL